MDQLPVLSQAQIGDIFRPNNPLHTFFGIISYVLVTGLDGGNIRIDGCDVHGNINHFTANANLMGLTDINTTYVGRRPYGRLAQAAGRRRRKSRSRKFRKSRRRR